jgi:uncharacterized phage protein (TIGR02220 family)
MGKKEDIKQERIQIAERAVNYLNTKADRKFVFDGKGTLQLFTAEWALKYGINQYKGVIDYLVLKWKDDPSMERYLRPSTLFGRDKFPEYLEEARACIRNERMKKRLRAFSNYIPVEESESKQLSSFSNYDGK